jgi:carbonic anhydrase
MTTKHLRCVAFAAALLATALFSNAGQAEDWSYEGKGAPENWGKLDPKFTLCSTGRNQSPIDIDGTIAAQLKPLQFKYGPFAREIENNGHTVQVNYAPGSALIFEGQYFQLVQFHFHTPSENKITGKSFPLEAHLVHADKSGNLAVLGIMFTAGAPNAFLAKLWDKMPAKKGDKSELPAGLNVTQMLPTFKAYYRFNGSLTTPPCSEGVRWLMMKSPVTASKEQIERFAKAVGHANARPLQPVFARPVLR